MTRIHAGTVVRHLLTSREGSDDELLSRYLAARDDSAFAVLVRRHGPMVLNVCRRVLHHDHDAEDAFQATFVVLARNASAVRSRGSLASWLHGVARRVALKTRAARRSAAPLDAVEPTAPAVDPSWREIRAVLDEELERLPEPLRGPLVLCYLEGLTRDEAAARLGCPLGTLKGRLERGREQLRHRLTRRGLALSAALTGLALERVSLSTARAASFVGAGVEVPARVLELARGFLPASRLTSRAVLAALLVAAVAGGVALMLPTPTEPPADTPPMKAENEAPLPDEKRRLDVHGDPLPKGAVARLGSLRLVHGHWGGRVVLSPDAKHVVWTAGENHLWDAVTGKELPLAGELKRLFVFVADGKLLAANPQPGGRIVDLLTGKEVPADGIDVVAESNKARGIGDGFSKPAQSPDGKLSATRDGNRIRIFDTATHKELPALADQPDAGTQSITFSPDGKRLAASYAEAEPVPGVRVWDLTTRKLIARLPAQGGHVEHTAFSADGRTLAGSDGPSVTLWDVASGKWLHDFGHTSTVGAVAFTPDGKTVVTGGSYTDGIIRVWDPLTGKERARWLGHTSGIDGLAFLPDGRTVVSASQDRTVRLWDSTTGKEIRRLVQTPESLWALAVAPDGKTLATRGAATVRLWDVTTGKELCTFGDKPTTRLAFSPDGKRIATITPDARVVVLRDAATGREVRQFKGRGPIFTVPVFSPDGTLVAVGDKDGPIHLWETATGRARVLGETLKATVVGEIKLFTVAFSPEGRTLAAGYLDGEVVLWEVASGRERGRFTGGHRGIVGRLAFSPDGSLLVSGSGDRTAVVWDVMGRHTVGPSRGEPTAKELLTVWEWLADADAVKAYRAVRTLADAGKSAVPFLKVRLRSAAPADAGTVERLLKELDSDEFAAREAASKGLLHLGGSVEAALRKALAGEPSAEARRRLEAVLAQLDPAANPEALRELRAVEALEGAGTAESRAVLGSLAEGEPTAPLTRAARAALDRLAKRR